MSYKKMSVCVTLYAYSSNVRIWMGVVVEFLRVKKEGKERTLSINGRKQKSYEKKVIINIFVPAYG